MATAHNALQIPSEPASPAGRLVGSPGFLHGLLIFMAVSMIYLPTLQYQFVNWDDPWYVKNNPLIHHWSLSNLWSIISQPAIRNYHPLTLLVYLLQYSVWGVWAGGYHLVNLLLHGLNSILVYTFLHQVLRHRRVALLSALLFAVHPVHVESVAWISSMKGLLNAAFTLSCLICWCRPERTQRDELKALGFLVLALLAKPLGVVVPALLLGYDLIVRRQRFAEAFPHQIIPGLLALWFLFKNMLAQSALIGGVRGHLELSKLEILGLDQLILWKYVGMLLCPRDLNVLYAPPLSGNGPWIAVSTLAWAAVAVCAWKQRHNLPLWFWGLSCFLILLFPVLNLFPITTLMNDRYLYLPSIAVLAMLATTVVRCLDWLEATTVGSRNGILAMTAALAGLWAPFALQSVQQREVWRNGESLWTHAMHHAPQIAVVRIQRALIFQEQGRLNEAIDLLESGLTECNPDAIDRRRMEDKIRNWRDLLLARQLAASSMRFPSHPALDDDPDTVGGGNLNREQFRLERSVHSAQSPR